MELMDINHAIYFERFFYREKSLLSNFLKILSGFVRAFRIMGWNPFWKVFNGDDTEKFSTVLENSATYF